MGSARISDRQTHLQIMSFFPESKVRAETTADRLMESGAKSEKVKREGRELPSATDRHGVRTKVHVRKYGA
jgi:hypothetical protein